MVLGGELSSAAPAVSTTDFSSWRPGTAAVPARSNRDRCRKRHARMRFELNVAACSRKSSSPIAGKSPCGSREPAARWASLPPPFLATRTAPRCMSAWPMKRTAIGPAPSRESYLRIDKLMEVARRAGCDALHPGYGFLAENPELARACAANNITFIGPSARSDGAPGIENRRAPTRRAGRRAHGSRNQGSDRKSERCGETSRESLAIPCC